MSRAEYVTDVAYVRSFHPDLAPSRLGLVAALNGFSPPPADDFDYCELGCAQGDSTVVLAASNPRARFVGVDLNPEHIAVAEQNARDGGVSNVRFLERDFAALEDLGTFDYVCAHGVLSWVGPDKRKAVLDFANARLKPGGLLYVSYNAMPGWAAVEPLRQLLLSRADAEGDSLERARKGLDFAKQMFEAGAEYFIENPPAREMLATMEQMGLRYVVHEYLHAHWAPMYFAQVAWEMASSNLHFAGSLPLHSNYRDIAIPASLTKVFASAADRVTFESLKDFALNAYFRRDIFVKGKTGRAVEITQTHLDRTHFALARADRSDVQLPHHTLRFKGAIFDTLFDTLVREGAATGAELGAHPALARFGADQVRAALLRMLLGDHVSPVQGMAAEAVAPADGALLRVASAFDRAMLARRMSSDVPIVLASELAGTGIPLTPLEAVAVRLLTEVPAAERAAWVKAHFGKDELRMRIGNRSVESPEEQARLVFEALERVERELLPRLLRLGVLVAAA